MRSRFTGGQLGGAPRGVNMDGTVMVMVTVKAEGEDPFGVVDAGATVHVANEGAPVQDRAMVPVKPFSAETCKL